MTVAELIEALSKMPQDAEVHVQVGYDSWSGPEYEPLTVHMVDPYIPWPPGTPGATVTLGY